MERVVGAAAVRRVTRLGARRRAVSRRALQARKFVAVGQLASGIAHEINTPTQYIGDNLRFLLDAFAQLTSVLPADAVERAGLSEELAYLLEEIPSAITQSLDGVGRVSQVVGAVKRFATASVGNVVMLDLNDAIENVLALAYNEWKYVARLERELEAGLPLVPCAEGELKPVILGLVLDAARAVKAAPDAKPAELGCITIATRHDGEYVTLSVRDSGIVGASATDARSATRRARALAFAHDVLVERGGTIEVTATEGSGTTVVVRLPLHGDVDRMRSSVVPPGESGSNAPS
jgi:two-component system NtrC family sensor kinase